MMKKIAAGLLGFLLSTLLLGFGGSILLFRFLPASLGMYEGEIVDYSLLFYGKTYLLGAAVTVLLVLIYLLFARPSAARAKKLMKSKAENFESNLENSRFMTEKERDFNFDPYQFTKLSESKKDGIPVYANFNKKRSPLISLHLGIY